MATDEQQLFSNEKTRMVTRFLWWLALIVVSGVLGGMYMYINRPARAAKITPESCTTMCGENGLEEYNLDECRCRRAPVQVPSINITPTTVEKIENVVCTCRPATRLEEDVARLKK